MVRVIIDRSVCSNIRLRQLGYMVDRPFSEYVDPLEVWYSRTAPQEVRIYYRDIGLVDELPENVADSLKEEIPNEVA